MQNSIYAEHSPNSRRLLVVCVVHTLRTNFRSLCVYLNTLLKIEVDTNIFESPKARSLLSPCSKYWEAASHYFTDNITEVYTHISWEIEIWCMPHCKYIGSNLLHSLGIKLTEIQYYTNHTHSLWQICMCKNRITLVSGLTESVNNQVFSTSRAFSTYWCH